MRRPHHHRAWGIPSQIRWTMFYKQTNIIISSSHRPPMTALGHAINQFNQSWSSSLSHPRLNSNRAVIRSTKSTMRSMFDEFSASRKSSEGASKGGIGIDALSNACDGAPAPLFSTVAFLRGQTGLWDFCGPHLLPRPRTWEKGPLDMLSTAAQTACPSTLVGQVIVHRCDRHAEPCSWLTRRPHRDLHPSIWRQSIGGTSHRLATPKGGHSTRGLSD